MVAGGMTLVRRSGHKTMFVRDALPGEEVTVEITEDKKDLAHANAVEVLTPSTDRVEPPCPVFRNGCGGCQWQHASFEAQQRYKVEIVTDSLRRIAKSDFDNVEFAGSVSQFDYRTMMRLAVDNGRAALRKRRSHDLVSLETCLIAHPKLRELITDGHFGDANEVTLRVSAHTGERLALVPKDAKVELPFDVLVTTKGNKGAITERVCDRDFRISAGSFFQSGPAAATLLTETVDSLIPGDIDWVVDAYAGVGLLGSVVAARRDCQLTSVEQSRISAVDAEHNLSDLEADVICTEVAKMPLPVSDVPDAVIADPARSGLGRSASAQLCAIGAEHFVLVSCDPASMARDIVLLDEQGYDLTQLKVLDLFPNTHHVETVALFVAR